MRSFWTCVVAMTVVLAATPAMACPFYRTAPVPEPPPSGERVIFTATIEERQSDLASGISASLRVRSRLLGQTRDVVAVSRQGFVRQGDTPDEVILVDCITYLSFESALMNAPLGSEVLVMGRKMSGDLVMIIDLALPDTPHGRELLALGNL